MASEIPLLGQGKPAEDTSGQIRSVRTAFLAYQEANGQWTISPDINVPIKPEHQALPDEMYACAAIIQSDIIAQKAGQATIQYQMLQAKAMADQQMTRKIQDSLARTQ